MKFSTRCLYRIVDANFNRAKEALRVTEDLLRFAANDKALAFALKKSRHRLTAILSAFPVSYKKLVASRDSRNDVGKNGVIRDRSALSRAEGLLTANFKRAQESLRVLEEVSKAGVSAGIARRFQRLRFEVYELEKRAVRKF